MLAISTLKPSLDPHHIGVEVWSEAASLQYYQPFELSETFNLAL